MSFRGRGSGGRGSRGGRGGRGGGRGGHFRPAEAEPETVIEAGRFTHVAESELVCVGSLSSQVPYFNAGAYLENKTRIGKIDEVFGPINEVMFTVKPEDGFPASSFKKDDKIYIAPDKVLPLSRFTSEQKRGGGGGRGRGGSAAGGRGGRGGFSGRGRGGMRGSSRGGFRGSSFSGRGRGGRGGRGRG